MPYLETAQLWLTQSTLLLQARPSTTRITTKYTIRSPTSSKSKSKPPPTTTPTTTANATTTTPQTQPEPPRAHLTLKTYDPLSGTTLKYRTTKAAEVSRLIQILGRLARPMAGLSVLPLDMDAPAPAGAAPEGSGSGTGTPAVEAPAATGGAQGGGAGGKKNKKKGGKK